MSLSVSPSSVIISNLGGPVNAESPSKWAFGDVPLMTDELDMRNTVKGYKRLSISAAGLTVIALWEHMAGLMKNSIYWKTAEKITGFDMDPLYSSAFLSVLQFLQFSLPC